jgi:hypothetical protein
MALKIRSKYKCNAYFDHSLEMLVIPNKYPRRMCTRVVTFKIYFVSGMTTDLILNIVFSGTFRNQWSISLSYC